MKTLFALLAEYETAQIPLEKCAHLFGLAPDVAARRAKLHRLPVPAFRAESQKAPWLVDATALAEYLDKLKEKAANEWERLHSA